MKTSKVETITPLSRYRVHFICGECGKRDSNEGYGKVPTGEGRVLCDHCKAATIIHYKEPTDA